MVGDDEAAEFGIAIAAVFEKAGWDVDKVIGRQMQAGYVTSESLNLTLYAPAGVTTVDNATAKMAFNALTTAGLRVSVGFDSTTKPESVNLFVGHNRPEKTKQP
jgi:hypothetical protein